MFVDASAIIAILEQEDDWRLLSARLENAERIYASPLSIWEAAVGLTRQSQCPFEIAEGMVRRFIEEVGAETIPIDDEIGREALRASRLYGRSRHKAALNFGDCFAYACARVRQIPLLYKGQDFSKTDIEAA